VAEFAYPPVSFDTHPDRYVHWDVGFDGAVARLVMHVKEERPLWPGRYELKLNSYDLGVDIELNDVVQRLRFEHPEVSVVVVSGAYDKVFCAGANIRMLGMSPHAFKVNFCKFTNETRTSIEDSSRHSGLTWVAALNGTASGGGYELALACDKIVLIDDGNAAVSLPEVPLLGVLPGTGGLTRLTDKRKVRRDMGDVFCTKAEGFRARDAKKHGFIDESFPRSKWEEGVKGYAKGIADKAKAKQGGTGVPFPPLEISPTDKGWSYRFVGVSVAGRVATVELRAPETTTVERSAATWSLQAFRELEDALLRLRFNHLEVGLVLLETTGDPAAVLAHEAGTSASAESDWFFQEVLFYQARVLRRLDNMAKSLFAIVKPGSCFVGTLFELALACDRIYMLADEERTNAVALTAANGGLFPMATGKSRLEMRFPGDADAPGKALAVGGPIDAPAAEKLGLVTQAPDDIDWDDEVRIAVEERVSLSPDALTGMEQNLRFPGSESAETKIYGRLSAWQNWIFQRPNAVGERGALTMYGDPERPVFDFRRT
jgi:benzoyl-CoA-dihydrodiol lyase